MYAKSTRPSAKRKVQKERSAKRAARDENVPAKRADFFFIIINIYFYPIRILNLCKPISVKNQITS